MDRLPASHPSPARSRRLRRAARRRHLGQGLAEFAILLPVMLLLLFTIIELARLLHAWVAVENGARFGLRYAVTGEYDMKYCPGGTCKDDSESDSARIQSVQDVARAGSATILRDDSLADPSDEGSPGFFRVTVCSTRKDASGGNIFTYSEPVPGQGISAYCAPSDDAGGPGDTVTVTVDFDHPLIVPIFSTLWPKIHLNASRDGIVETYRTARVVGLPDTYPTITLTPTNTEPPTDTPVPSETPTPTETLCKVPPVVSILQPQNGATYTTSLPSQAEAYDPDNADPENCSGVGDDGLGIENVQFSFELWNGSSWQGVYGRTESYAAYCGFGGNGPCPQLDIASGMWPNGQAIVSGRYRMRALATDDEGVTSGWAEVEFTIDMPPTSTPTVTPMPDCSKLTLGGLSVSNRSTYSTISVSVKNANPQDAYLKYTWFDWPDAGSMYVDWFEFENSFYYGGDDYTPPTTASSNIPFPGQTSERWRARLRNIPSAGVTGGFAVRFTFEYPGWGTCVLSASRTLTVRPVTATNTPPPATRTPTPKSTSPPPPTATKAPTRTPAPTNSASSTPSVTPVPSNTPTLPQMG